MEHWVGDRAQEQRRRRTSNDPQAPAAGAGHAAADQLRLDRRRGAGAGRHGDRRGGRGVLRGAEAAVVPEGVRLPEVPAHVGPDARRTSSSACGWTCSRTRSATASSRPPTASVTEANIDAYIAKNGPIEIPRAARSARRADQDARAGAAGAERARARGDLEAGRAALLARRAVVRARRRAPARRRPRVARRSRSTAPCSAPARAGWSVRSRPGTATTCSRSPGSRRRR